MPVMVHHRPVDPSRSYTLHAWIGTKNGEAPGTRRGDVFDFELPDLGDLRRLRFMFFSTDRRLHVNWEDDAFIRRIRLSTPSAIWAFGQAARILYQDPTPPGVTFKPGDLLTFHVVTRSRFKGGKVYAWNPLVPGAPTAMFDQVSRSDPISTFAVRLQPWMTAGFHFKLVGRDGAGNAVWEPDSSNRVWSPGDGDSLWLKSGQVSVRGRPLDLTSMPLDVLYPAAMAPPPELTLIDEVDDFRQTFPPVSSAPFPGGPPFRVAHYSIPIYPDAAYAVCAARGSTAPALAPVPRRSRRPHRHLAVRPRRRRMAARLPGRGVGDVVDRPHLAVELPRRPEGRGRDGQRTRPPDGGGRPPAGRVLGGTGHRPGDRRELDPALARRAEGDPPLLPRPLRRVDRHPPVLHASARGDDLLHPRRRLRRGRAARRRSPSPRAATPS